MVGRPLHATPHLPPMAEAGEEVSLVEDLVDDDTPLIADDVTLVEDDVVLVLVE